jgi:hypothetical protein
MARNAVITVRLSDREAAVLDAFALKNGVSGGRAGSIRALIGGLNRLDAYSGAAVASQHADEPGEELSVSDGTAVGDVCPTPVKGERSSDAAREIAIEVRPEPVPNSAAAWQGLYAAEQELADRYQLAERWRDYESDDGETAAGLYIRLLVWIANETGHRRGSEDHLREADGKLKDMAAKWDREGKWVARSALRVEGLHPESS